MPREGDFAAALGWRLGQAAQCEGLGCGWSAPGAASSHRQVIQHRCCIFDMSIKDLFVGIKPSNELTMP